MNLNLREKLLVKLAQDPAYEGMDETEKALVIELRAEMANSTEATAEVDSEVKAAAKELAGQMTEMVKSLLEAQNKTEPNRDAIKSGEGEDDSFAEEVKTAAVKAGVKTEDQEAFKTFSKAYHFSEFAKGLFNKDLKRVKALAEGVDGDGGYLVPDAFRAELIQHMIKTNAIRNFATVIPMTGKLLELPKLTSDVKVYWGTENRSIATTTADFGNMTLTPFRLNAIIYTSRELFDDSALSIFDILKTRFRDRVADEENRVFINGNGTTQPKGIDAETFRTVNAGNALSPDHLTEAYYKLPEAYRNVARWLINSRTIAHLETRKDTTGAYLYPSLQAEVKTLKGRPILVTDHVASTKIFLGDLSNYYIGDRQQLTMDVTTEGGNTWEKYQVGLRVIERLDGEVGLTVGFVEITNTGVN